jgi:hypothetical protein
MLIKKLQAWRLPFRPAKDHWIPYRLASPDENIDDFSHRDYTELVFKHQPTNIRLLRKFNEIFFDDNSQGLKLIKSMWEKLDDNQKEKFYKNFSLMLSERIADSSHRGKARSEIFRDKLEVLFNEFYFGNQVNQPEAVQKVETLFSSEPLIWKGKSIELFELMDALYRCDKVHATQKQIVNFLNLNFAGEYDLDQFQKAISEIKNDRVNKTKFLTWLVKAYRTKITE